MAWIELHNSSTYRLRVAEQTAAGALRGPFMVAQDRGTPPAHPGIGDDAIAYEPGGGLLIAYDRAGEVHIKVVTDQGTVGPAQNIGPAFAFGNNSISLAVDRSGGGVIAWETEPGGEDAPGPSRVYTTVRASTGGLFHPAVLMGRGVRESVMEGWPSLAVSPSGSTVIEYGIDQRSKSKVYAASGSIAQGFGHP